MISPSDFRFRHRLQVRWVEVDAQQVVFNGHYLTYLDVAMSGYWRAVGLPYPDAFAFLQGDVFVRRNALQYLAPARLDDRLDIGIRCAGVGNSSINIEWAIWTQGRLLVTGETTYVFTGLDSGRPQTVPASIRTQLQRHEAGQPVHEMRVGSWSDERVSQGARAVRLAVFVGEQGIPESEEWDADDAMAVHALVCNLAGTPLGTGRLIMQGLPPGHGKIGRMAVVRSARGAGLGDQILLELMAQARQQGLVQIDLHAQVSAKAFYARHGFMAHGPEFDEVGIPHQRMTLTLSSA
jgi:YbgC/YbaW family acyl-CoA thioester hydrolase